MKMTVATLLAATALSAAHAQTVYRCGNTYSRATCPQAKLVEVGDTRSAAQQAEARRVAEDEMRLAEEMQRERLADERAIRSSGAASLSGPAPVTLAVTAPRHRYKKVHARAKTLPTTDFISYDPSSRKRRNGA